MKRCQIQFCIYFILQVFGISLCDENPSSEDSYKITQPQELIDPHSLYYNRHSKEMQKPKDEKKIFPDIVTTMANPTESVDSLNCECEQKLQECRDEKIKLLPFELFSKRLVNMLLAQVVFKEENEMFTGNVRMEARVSQIQVLRDFGSGKVSIRQVDSVLSDIIRTPKTTFLDDAITYTELLFSTINTHRNTCIGILVAISIISVSRFITWTRGKIIFLILDIIFIISFFMTWYQLIKEAEIKQTAKQMVYANMPIECQPEKMGMIQYIVLKLSFRENVFECAKYIEARTIDPVAQVTPAHALIHMCTNFIVHPVSLAGHMIGNFVENATGQVSWPMKWVVTLLLFIGVALVIIMLPFSLFGGSLGFGFGPLFHFTLNGAKQKGRGRLSYQNQRKRVELIQEVPINTTIQRIEASPMKIKETSQMVKLPLENKDSKDEEALSESLSTTACFDKAKGDSATIDECDEETCKLELSDKEKSKMKSIQEVGGGDS